MKVLKYKKHIFKIIALVLIQAFFTLDFACAGGNEIYSSKRVQQAATLAPLLTIDSGIVHQSFEAAGFSQHRFSKQEALQILSNDEYRDSIQRFLAATNIKAKSYSGKINPQTLAAAVRIRDKEKARAAVFEKAWYALRDSVTDKRELIPVLESLLFDHRPFVQYIAMVELSILDLKEVHTWKIASLFRKKIREISRTSALIAADADIQEEQTARKVDFNALGQHALVEMVPKTLEKIKAKSRLFTALVRISLTANYNIIKINAFLREEHITHDASHFFLHPEIYVIRALLRKVMAFKHRDTVFALPGGKYNRNIVFIRAIEISAVTLGIVVSGLCLWARIQEFVPGNTEQGQLNTTEAVREISAAGLALNNPVIIGAAIVVGAVLLFVKSELIVTSCRVFWQRVKFKMVLLWAKLNAPDIVDKLVAQELSSRKRKFYSRESIGEWYAFRLCYLTIRKKGKLDYLKFVEMLKQDLKKGEILFSEAAESGKQELTGVDEIIAGMEEGIAKRDFELKVMQQRRMIERYEKDARYYKYLQGDVRGYARSIFDKVMNNPGEYPRIASLKVESNPDVYRLMYLKSKQDEQREFWIRYIFLLAATVVAGVVIYFLPEIKEFFRELFTSRSISKGPEMFIPLTSFSIIGGVDPGEENLADPDDEEEPVAASHSESEITKTDAVRILNRLMEDIEGMPTAAELEAASGGTYSRTQILRLVKISGIKIKRTQDKVLVDEARDRMDEAVLNAEILYAVEKEDGIVPDIFEMEEALADLRETNAVSVFEEEYRRMQAEADILEQQWVASAENRKQKRITVLQEGIGKRKKKPIPNFKKLVAQWRKIASPPAKLIEARRRVLEARKAWENIIAVTGHLEQSIAYWKDRPQQHPLWGHRQIEDAAAVSPAKKASRFIAETRTKSYLFPDAEKKIEAVVAKLVPQGARVLDLMSGAHTYVPESVNALEVVGIGLNHKELKLNERLTGFFAQDLNENPQLPEDWEGLFDVVLITSGMAYLKNPQEIFTSAARVLKPGGVIIITFNKNVYEEEATDIWKKKDMHGREGFTITELRAVLWFDRVISQHTTYKVIENNSQEEPLVVVVGFRDDSSIPVCVKTEETPLDPDFIEQAI
ncbi:MAG: methyltransferase domain-containing protein [Candidatus Omnitrophota bacterium]